MNVKEDAELEKLGLEKYYNQELSIYMVRKKIASAYEVKGYCERLPVNPEIGDVYIFRDKAFIWCGRWQIERLIKEMPLREKLLNFIQFADDDNLIEVLENFIKEYKKEQG